jgi:hypothetical protein
MTESFSISSVKLIAYIKFDNLNISACGMDRDMEPSPTSMLLGMHIHIT